MSYCRFGEADIYLFLNIGGGAECCMCSLAIRKKFVVIDRKLTGFKRVKKSKIAKKFSLVRKNYVEKILCPAYLRRKHGYFYTPDPHLYTYSAVFEHLRRHIDVGDYIPEHVFDRLKQEQLVAINDLIPSHRQYGKRKSGFRRTNFKNKFK